jgi:hypothetical protein
MLILTIPTAMSTIYILFLDHNSNTDLKLSRNSTSSMRKWSQDDLVSQERTSALKRLFTRSSVSTTFRNEA